ncbi:hypothetical protein GCM10023310_41860 [Paenibacillus vulneris]|uniref:Uncharacterized protein n=1 Tax=Paenibacillus vulneris TaxID=1133364 RepID=A0ABW3URK3_9BACL|nr:hypothetical protein [Paenibacillus sp. 32352]
MKLIQLILNNWFLVVIAFIVLSNIGKMFKSKTQNDPDKPAAPKQGMPPFAGGGAAGTGWGRTRKQTVTQNKDVKPRSEPSGRPVNPQLQEQPKPAPAASEGPETTDYWNNSPLEHSRKTASGSANRSSRQPFTSEKPITPGQPSAEQLAQGIIWAEILGPPRAKKPFRK